MSKPISLPVYCVLFPTKREHLKMTLSSFEGTLQPTASHETCLFVGCFFFIFILIQENFAVCLLSQGEKRKYKT